MRSSLGKPTRVLPTQRGTRKLWFEDDDGARAFWIVVVVTVFFAAATWEGARLLFILEKVYHKRYTALYGENPKHDMHL